MRAQGIGFRPPSRGRVTASKSTNDPTTPLVSKLLGGDRGALARAITFVENETDAAPDIFRGIRSHLGRALVVGFTGAPGTGKSTLVSAYAGELRRRALSVGIVAVDPSSPITGGALLGDRIRMHAHSEDKAVFIRSLASRGHVGGLSKTAARVIDLMDAAGKDVVIVETVGIGQSEIEVAEIADAKVVVCAPGLGDEVQAMKAGVLEIADILVVNKADLPFADRTMTDLAAMIELSSRDWKPPVLRTVATTGEGVSELADAIGKHEARAGGTREAKARGRVQRLIANLAAHNLAEDLMASDDPRLAELCEGVLRGEVALEAAAAKAITTYIFER